MEKFVEYRKLSKKKNKKLMQKNVKHGEVLNLL